MSEDQNNESKKTKKKKIGVYEKNADVFELKGGSHIVTSANGKPTDIKAGEIIYDQRNLNVNLVGDAEIEQGSDYVRGDVVQASLFSDRKVKFATAKGNTKVILGCLRDC